MELATEATKRKVMSIEEAAAALGMCRNAIYEAAKTGEIPTVRVGRRVLVPIAALERMLNGPTAA